MLSMMKPLPHDKNHLWIITGDFNYIRYPSNRNVGSGDMNNMMEFNATISQLALVEIPLKGIWFTWCNMQQAPLLEKIDSEFTSENWSSNYPNTLAIPLAKPVSDHCPFVIKIGTSIPRAQVFRFENFWLQHHDFQQAVKYNWQQPILASDIAKLNSA